MRLRVANARRVDCHLGRSSTRLHRQWAERWRWHAALRGSFIGRGDLQEHIFLARLSPEYQGKGQPGLRNSGRRVGGDRHVACTVRTEREDRIVDSRDIARRDQDLRQARVRTVERLAAQILGNARLPGPTDLAWRKWRM